MGRRRMKNYNPMAIAESPMTAPDSVERVVAEMRIPHEGGWDNDDVAALADRLQALARGPQQAGGGAAKWTPEEVARQLAERPNQPHYIAALVRKAIAHETAALQTEVARLLIRIETLRSTADRATGRAEAAEAALREAGRDAFRKGWVNAAKWAQRDDLLADIGSPAYVTEREAALNGGQDDA